MLNKWGDWVRDRLDRHTLIFLVSALLLIGIYCWGLGSPGLKSSENQAIGKVTSIHAIMTDPTYAPHNFAQYVLWHFNLHKIMYFRLVSAVFGLAYIYCFYVILRSWFGRFIAWLGTLLFATTPLLILAGRSASGVIMYLWPLVVIAAYMKMVRSKDGVYRHLVLVSLLAAIAIYQPGGLIFLLLGLIYTHGTLAQIFYKLPKKQSLSALFIFLVCLVPAVLASVRHINVLKELVLVPQHMPVALQFAKDAGWSFMSFFWHSRNHHELQLGKVEILNATQTILLIFGLYALWAWARSKIYDLAGLFLLVVLAASLNHDYNLLIIGVPALAVVTTAGLRYLHLEWTTVFPRNPLPRGLAILLLATVVAINIAWGIHYSLTAWPHALIR